MQNPGKFDYSANTTLEDAIFLSNGLTEAADSTFIEVTRRLNYKEASKLSDQLVYIFTFHLDRNLRLNPNNAAFILQPFDHISVKKAPGFQAQELIDDTGEVKYSGTYMIRNKNRRISDLIEMTGGLTNYAFHKGATLNHYTSELSREKYSY